MNRRTFLTASLRCLKALAVSPVALLGVKAKPWTFVTAEYNGKGTSDGTEIYGRSPAMDEKWLSFEEWSHKAFRLNRVI